MQRCARQEVLERAVSRTHTYGYTSHCNQGILRAKGFPDVHGYYYVPLGRRSFFFPTHPFSAGLQRALVPLSAVQQPLQLWGENRVYRIQLLRSTHRSRAVLYGFFRSASLFKILSLSLRAQTNIYPRNTVLGQHSFYRLQPKILYVDALEKMPCENSY